MTERKINSRTSSKSNNKTKEFKPVTKKLQPKIRRKTTRKKKKVKKIVVKPWVVVAICIAFSVLAYGLFLSKTNSNPEGVKVPAIKHYGYGIDISHHNNKDIKWDSLKVMIDNNGYLVDDISIASKIEPVKFVYMKATEGGNFKDKQFSKFWRQAGKHDIGRGAYHFFRSNKDGEQQAKFFIKTVGSLRYKDLPPMLDIETIHAGCSKQLLNERALQWLKTVEMHYGKKPIVYASDSFIKDYLSKDITNNYPIWVAHYKTDKPKFDNWLYWQFTEEATVYGIDGPVDLNIINIKKFI